MVQKIDFSCKHDVMIRNEDGSLQPMDEPYFKAVKIAEGTWQILSDGDYSYLVEGDDEALVIDSGYGAGNLRAFCQTMTDRPVRRIANTHYHFDHTANNAYFDCACMSAEAKPLATIPFPSFAGIEFPRDYPVQIIGEGYIFHLGGRDLETYAISNHAVGSLMFLDRKARILFSGDELMPEFFSIKTPIGNVKALLGKMVALKPCFDRFCGGPGIMDCGLAGRYLKAIDYLTAGNWDAGEPMPPRVVPPVSKGQVIYDRRKARPCDMPRPGEDEKYWYTLEHGGIKLIYDIRAGNSER